MLQQKSCIKQKVHNVVYFNNPASCVNSISSRTFTCPLSVEAPGELWGCAETNNEQQTTAYIKYSAPHPETAAKKGHDHVFILKPLIHTAGRFICTRTVSKCHMTWRAEGVHLEFLIKRIRDLSFFVCFASRTRAAIVCSFWRWKAAVSWNSPSAVALASNQTKQLLVFSHKLHWIAENYFSIQRTRHITKKTASYNKNDEEYSQSTSSRLRSNTAGTPGPATGNIIN